MVLQNQKSLGQNWLKDRPTLEKIASLAFCTADLCVEIGPGLGTLTSSLLRRFPKVLAIEFDPKLAQNLPASFPGKNLTVINQDVLNYDFSNITEPYVVVGNIPYYITTPIIKKLLLLSNHPLKIVLLVQKEVAEKLAAKTLDVPSSSLSLFVDCYAKASLGPIVPKTLFTPIPKVDSRVLILTPHKAPLTSNEVLSFIKSCFVTPRKKLLSVLPRVSNCSKQTCESALSSLNLSHDVRPGNLTLANYAKLAQILKKR
ncbi:ribosomal RNA small subunit methyltransferase A [Candidatus Saccharibacteria bacterium]|nr:ribosomal RNA small subunit methyltransferase A [Candidatus Saccharibacteria bacterium]